MKSAIQYNVNIVTMHHGAATEMCLDCKTYRQIYGQIQTVRI